MLWVTFEDFLLKISMDGVTALEFDRTLKMCNMTFSAPPTLCSKREDFEKFLLG